MIKILNNISVNIIKWLYVLCVLAYYNIYIFDFFIVIILAIVDLVLLLILKSPMLKAICCLGIWWFLLPLFQENIASNYILVISFFVITIALQLIEYRIWKKYIEKR